ncbi:hypothetical protein LCGC14_2406460, partial [marine sediment metagenome]
GSIKKEAPERTIKGKEKELRTHIYNDSGRPEAIKRIEGGKSKVYAVKRSYISTFPYDTLIAMLKEEDAVDKNVSGDEFAKQTMVKLSKVLDKSTHFGG